MRLRAPLLLVFVIAELWATIGAGVAFGTAPVMLWLFGAAILGVSLIVGGGHTALRRAADHVQRGELPALPMFEGLITALAGVLFLIPGVLTDVMAVALLIVGRVMRQRLARLLSAQLARARPDLRPPVTIEGEVVSRSTKRLR